MAGLWALGRFIVFPFLRMEWERRVSRKHTPQPMEIWIQDSTDLLYIDATGPTGVEIMMFDPETKQISRWKDTWQEWSRRLEIRNVRFTGQRRPLGDA